MRLADDRRARVPFALVGVLLLVSSSVYAVTLSTRGPATVDRSVETAMERATADVTPALRSAVRTAARDAAREPVTDPANSSAGRLLDEETPFRDALRLRIYVVARRHLRSTRSRHGGVTARASLAPTPNESALADAMRRVRVTGVQNGTALEVTVEGVRVVARRDGEVVVRRNRTVTLTVASPVLLLHDRARRFQRRLNRGPLAGPGLGRRLSARLYPVVWARAYAQYAGAPVQNVLANRHVEVATNGAVLASQRAAFGRSDPGGRRGLRRARVHVGARDLLAPVDVPDPKWTRHVLTAPNGPPDGGARIPRLDPADAPSPGRRITVGVNRSSGRAFDRLLEGAGGNDSLAALRREGYRTRVRLRTATRRVAGEPRPEPVAPGPGWRLESTSVSSSAEVKRGPGPDPSAGRRERTFRTFSRVVRVEHVVRWTWTRGNASTTTRATWRERYRVGVAVTGEHDPSGHAPERPVRPIFERGGALDGPNLADVPERAVERLVVEQGGRDAVARRVALGTLDERNATLVGERPAALRDWVYGDVASLRRRLRNVTVTTSAGRLATFRTNPAARLAARLRSKRDRLVGAPDRYDGVADRTRVAARAAYLDRVIAALEARAARRNRTERAVDGVLRRAGAGSTDRLYRILATRTDLVRPDRRPVLARGNLTGGVRVVPDAGPAYLTLAGVDHGRVPAVPRGRRYHPLVARNVNLFALPYGDAAEAAVADSFARPRRVRLRTAARLLVASERAVAATGDPRLRERRGRLRTAVSRSVDRLGRRSRRVLRRETELSASARRDAVSAAFGRWRGPGRQALAAANGTLADAVAGAAVARGADVARDRLAVQLRSALAAARRERRVMVPQRVTNRTATTVRAVAKGAARRGATRYAPSRLREAGGWVGSAMGGLPAGVPVAPVPGYWYATANVWTVRVRGAYARFVLRTRRGGPGRALRYVRDGSTATLDVDGDGRPERLGRDERIAFETRTAVAVAVPGQRGVGDVDGDRTEQSLGWPRPACLRTRETCRPE